MFVGFVTNIRYALTLPKHKPCSVVLNVFYFAKHKSGIAMPITEPP